MKHLKIAVMVGVIIVALIFLFPFIQQALITKQEGELIKKQTDAIREASEKQIYCNEAKIQIKSANYDNTNKKLSASIKNTGNVALSDIKFVTILKNTEVARYNSTPNEGLASNEGKVYSSVIENGCDINALMIVAESCAQTAREQITRANESFVFVGC